jgi:hypothetical protein
VHFIHNEDTFFHLKNDLKWYYFGYFLWGQFAKNHTDKYKYLFQKLESFVNKLLIEYFSV